MRHFSVPVAFAVLLLISCTSGQVGGAGGKIVIAPAEVTVGLAETQTFTASIASQTDQSVLWSVIDANGGAIDAAGLYTAPRTGGTYLVRATSKANPEVFGLAKVTVMGTPVIRIAPAKTTTQAEQKVVFKAQVLGLADTKVAWSVVEAAGGLITPAGVYVAPKEVGTYHVRATSASQPEVFAEVAIDVIKSSALQLYPEQQLVRQGQTVQLKPVSWIDESDQPTFSVPANGGTIDAQGIYTPPSKPGSYLVTASSSIDPTATATAELIVMGPPKVLSGAITYKGSRKGKVYVTATTVSTDRRQTLGTALDAPGAYRIEGLDKPGLYVVQAWLDVGGQRFEHHALNPRCEADLTFNGEDAMLNCELVDGTDFEVRKGPVVTAVAVTDGAAYVAWRRAMNKQGRDIADSYTVYWSTEEDVTPETATGSRTVPVVQGDGRLIITGLPNGEELYFTIAANVAGEAVPAESASGPYTIGAPTSGLAVTGSVQLGGVTTTGADVWVLAESWDTWERSVDGAAFVRVNSAQANPTYALKGLDEMTYELIVFVDRNKDGQVTLRQDRFSGLRERPYLSMGGATPPTTGPSLTLSNVDADFKTHQLEWYDHDTTYGELMLGPSSGNKDLERVTLKSGPQVAGRYEFAMSRPELSARAVAEDTIFEDLPWAEEPMFELASAVVEAGATYELELRFSDGTTAMKTVQVPPRAPRPAMMSPGRTASATPELTWSLPSPAAEMRISVWQPRGGGWSTQLQSTATKVTYGQDDEYATALVTRSFAYWALTTKLDNSSECNVRRSFMVMPEQQ